MSIGVLATNYCRAKKKPIEKKETWSCPPEGCLKINVDVTFDLDIGTGIMGAIVRDSNGKFIAASCKEIHFLTDAMMAEAYALRDGLGLAEHLGCQNFITNLIMCRLLRLCFWVASPRLLLQLYMMIARSYLRVFEISRFNIVTWKPMRSRMSQLGIVLQIMLIGFRTFYFQNSTLCMLGRLL
jgi:hypothetical protein